MGTNRGRRTKSWPVLSSTGRSCVSWASLTFNASHKTQAQCCLKSSFILWTIMSFSSRGNIVYLWKELLLVSLLAQSCKKLCPTNSGNVDSFFSWIEQGCSSKQRPLTDLCRQKLACSTYWTPGWLPFFKWPGETFKCQDRWNCKRFFFV